MRKELWDSMLDADMNARYWGIIARQNVTRDKYSKIFLAIMSSGAVAGWSIWNQVPWAWKSLSSFAALVAIILPILNFQNIINMSSDLAGTWLQIQVDYEGLWLIHENTELETMLPQYNNIKKREVEATKAETSLQLNHSLIESCYEQVLSARGLK